MSHIEHDYAGVIRRAGYRVTPQRQLILDTLCESGGFLTIGEITERVQAVAPAINQATVYRSLKFFREMNLIVTVETKGETVYELAPTPVHHHLICHECGAVQALADEMVQTFRTQLHNAYGFRAEIDDLTISGLCQVCREGH